MGQEDDVERPTETQFGSVNCVVPWVLSHAASVGESGMSTRNLTGQLVGASSTVSSSARKAA